MTAEVLFVSITGFLLSFMACAFWPDRNRRECDHGDHGDGQCSCGRRSR